MSVFSGIKTFMTKHNVVSKTVGGIGLGTILWDVNKNALLESDMYACKHDSNACLYYTNNAISQNSLCRITEKVKEKSLKDELDCGWRRFINLGIGYISGFAGNLFSHIVPTALSAGALFGKGFVARFSAVSLAAYSGFKLIKNYFGIGNPKSPFVK